MNKRNFYKPEDSAKVYLWALILPQLVSLVFACIFSAVYETTEQMQQSLFYIIVACTLAQVCFAFVLFYYNKKNNICIKTATNFNTKVSLKNVIWCIVISVIAVFGFVNFVGACNNLFAWLGFEPSSVSVPNNTFGWFLFNVIFLAFVPAVLEEFIFRGVIFNGLKQKGLWFAGIVSALMFALVHLSIEQFVFPIIMGVVFAFVVNKTGSLLYSIIVHFCNNFIVVLISYISTFTGRDIASFNATTPALVVLAIAIALVAGVAIWLIIKFLLKPDNKNAQVADSNALNAQSDATEPLQNINQQNELTNNVKNGQNGYVIVSLATGVVLWLIVVLGGLIA